MKQYLISLVLFAAVAGVFAFFFFRGEEVDAPLEKEQKENESAPTNTNNQQEDMAIEILQEGEGEEARIGNTVSVHYTGTLLDGTKFDSSRDKGVPFQFTLGAGQVIQGWERGAEGMKVGEIRKLTIPPHLAYGDRGVPGAIPPGATLIFEVELLEIGEMGK